MKLLKGGVVLMPVARIVFENQSELVDFEELADRLGMDKDWPALMLRDYLQSYKDAFTVPGKPFSWDLVESPTR